MRINFNKVICINLASVNAQQLFSICEAYSIGFEAAFKSKKEGTQMEWLDDERNVVAYVFEDKFYIGCHYSNVVKKDYDKIRNVKPVKTPKIPKTDVTLNNYKAFLSEGYEIRTKSLDSLIEHKLRQKEIPIIFDVDTILDKINKYGMLSLTKEEIDFLDNIKPSD